MRRKHNYLPLIMELLKVLAEEGKLVERVKYLSDKQRTKRSKSKPKS